MDEKKYESSYQVLKAVTLDELAEKLTNLSSESWSITVIKTTKVEDTYESLVKRVQELTQASDMKPSDPDSPLQSSKSPTTPITKDKDKGE